MRLIVMPAVILAVGLWFSWAQSSGVAAQTDRVRLFLTMALEECARNPQSQLKSLEASDALIAREFRARLCAARAMVATAVPMVDVRGGDFGAGATGDATHTALACFVGAPPVAVRVIATPNDGEVRVIGVFTPADGDFSDANRMSQ